MFLFFLTVCFIIIIMTHAQRMMFSPFTDLCLCNSLTTVYLDMIVFLI